MRKFQHQLYEKEQQVKDRKRQWLFDGKAQIITVPEFQKLVKDIQEKLHLKKEQKEAQAKERKKKADAIAALGHWKGQLLERYNEDIVAKVGEVSNVAQITQVCKGEMAERWSEELSSQSLCLI